MTNVDTKNFTYSSVFSFEKNFAPKRARHWMKENFSNAYYLCAVYIFVIFSIQYYMHNRRRFELKGALTLWNVGLAIFSISGALRSLPEFFFMLTKYSLYHSICYPIIMEPIEVIEFWEWLFALSKLVEFGDTIFVVLRKNPLNFLHWYHHVATLLCIWFAFANNSSYMRWTRSMNYCVHSLMYSYYALRASNFSIPKFIMVSITSLQIIQMVIGCAISLLIYYYHWTNLHCQAAKCGSVLFGVVYFSLLVLFCKFFHKVYVSPSRKKYSPICDNVEIKRK